MTKRGYYSHVVTIVACAVLLVPAIGRSTARGAGASCGWTQTDVPTIPGSAISGMAAFGPRSVWAVGSAKQGLSGAFIYRWTGSTWQLVRVFDPRPGRFVRLNAVGGTSSNDIWAVGHQSWPRPALIVHWDGRAWSVVPNPFRSASLHGVAANSARDVWVVGERADPADPDSGLSITFVGHWDGRRWSRVSSPNFSDPDGDPVENHLYGVAAISATEAWAVGEAFDKYGDGVSLAQRWDGRSWRMFSTPIRNNVSLNAVAAPRRHVWAAGGRGFPRRTGVQRWNGRRWQIVRGPAASGRFHAIAARTDADVWLLGGSTDPVTDLPTPVVQRWDGQGLRTMPEPDAEIGILAAAATREAIWAGGYSGVSTTGSSQSVIARYACR